MNYETFSKLWDIYVGESQCDVEITPTLQSLIEYGQGNKTKFEEIRKKLNFASVV